MSGVAVVVVAVWTILNKHQYISLLSTSNYLFCTYGLLLAGGLAVFGGFLGCCGVWRENRAIILFVSNFCQMKKGFLEHISMIRSKNALKSISMLHIRSKAIKQSNTP